MRGAFAIGLLSLIGAVGCSDPATDIQATQHGKRLDLVVGEDPTTPSSAVDDLTVTTLNRHLPTNAPSTGLYRDVAGIVLLDSKTGAQRLEQWILSQDGTEVRSRYCPLKAVGGVLFDECLPWTDPQSLADLDLAVVGPIRSFSTYLFNDGSGDQLLAQVAFNMAGDERVERTCPVIANVARWQECSSWLSFEESASALGVPQQTAFEDEVVVPYADKQGNPEFTQQLITPTGDAAWARSCAMTDGQIPGIAGGCAFSSEVRISALGIHFDAVQGVGGYEYTDGEARIYAQTVIAADGVSASRRLCPVTEQGVAFEQCLGWASIDLTSIGVRAAAL